MTDTQSTIDRTALYKRIIKSIRVHGGVQPFKEALMPHGIRNYNHYIKNGIQVSRDFLTIIHEEETKWITLANSLNPDFISPRQAANRLIKRVIERPELKHYLSYFLEYGHEQDDFRILADYFGFTVTY
jgi:hypothetical protein